MEYKTTQGGETTLTFDDQETGQILRTAKTLRTTAEHVTETLSRLRQANPIATFDELMGMLPAIYGVQAVAPKRAGIAPPGEQRMKDPVLELETMIRRRLDSLAGNGPGATSQEQQTVAILLQALATCVQTRVLAAKLDALALQEITVEASPLKLSGVVSG